MKYMCANCGNRVTLGRDLNYEIGIEFRDPFGEHIRTDKNSKQYETYCHHCEDAARKRFQQLIGFFNKTDTPKSVAQDDCATDYCVSNLRH